MIPMETNRLRFRKWKEEDRDAFYEMNADKEVMTYFPHVLTKEESDEFLDKIMKRMDAHGYGFWAVEEKELGRFIGFVGLNSPKVGLDIEPCLEIGWRLKKAFWGKGFATEGAKKILDYAFDVLDADKVYSFTTVANEKSENVMKKIGMKNTNTNFMHPNIPHEHPLQEHILYVIERNTNS